MDDTFLYKVISRLSLKSLDAVQNGQGFSDFDKYMHVSRPIEKVLEQKMFEIEHNGGGIVLLVGSAGDGKSHLLSQVKTKFDWSFKSYYNDATVSCSPKRTAIDTLKIALEEFSDKKIHTTSDKKVVAINLGKLNAFIEDSEVKDSYREIVNVVKPLFDDMPIYETEHIKVVLFTEEQLFEFHPDVEMDYPVASDFLSKVLSKIVSCEEDNPFYQAYLADLGNGVGKKSPLILNYELLMSESVRHTIVMSVIEAIIRFNLKITPREYFDFIYATLCWTGKYEEKDDFFEALLPTKLYHGNSTNKIVVALSKLDPLKYGSTLHDDDLAVLFTSYMIPKDFMDMIEEANVPSFIIERTNKFYANNGIDTERTVKFLFRFKHLLSYHTESIVYRKYLKALSGIFLNDVGTMKELYDIVSMAMPRHYGSYYREEGLVPLNLQGANYHFFSSLEMEPCKIVSIFDKSSPNHFALYIDMSWQIGIEKKIRLRLDYQLYQYLLDLNEGKLAVNYENERNIIFSKFMRQLSELCDSGKKLIIIGPESKKITFKENFGNLSLK